VTEHPDHFSLCTPAFSPKESVVDLSLTCSVSSVLIRHCLLDCNQDWSSKLLCHEIPIYRFPTKEFRALLESPSFSLLWSLYFQDYFDDLAKYMKVGPPLYFVVKDFNYRYSCVKIALLKFLKEKSHITCKYNKCNIDSSIFLSSSNMVNSLSCVVPVTNVAYDICFLSYGKKVLNN
jgi:hypothetical protein